MRARRRFAGPRAHTLVGALSLLVAGTAGADGVTFVVTPPAATPAGAVLWVSGDLDALGAWNGAGVKLHPLGDGRHTASVTLARGTSFEFKVTRGGWTTVEKDARGAEIANRPHTVSDDDTLAITVATWRDQVEGVPQLPTYIGTIRKHGAFPSAHVRARDVLVYLPPGYEADSTRRYPVLYFHDGQNVFDAATSMIGVEWGVDETAERLITSGTLAPCIVVAVANTGDRMAEYTPAADARHGGGRATDYAAFLIQELKPFVDSTYRTLPDRAHTGVVGSSLGGIASLYLGLEHPDVFGLVGCVSPSVWYAGGDILRRVAAGSATGLRIWLDMGTREGRALADGPSSIRGARALRAALVKRGYRVGVDLHYQEFGGAEHDERAWAKRTGEILTYLLAKVR